jgi:hypothetical protein
LITPRHTLRLGECTICIWPAEQRLETRFLSEKHVPATPNTDPTSVARAEALGYGADTWLMSLHHEILHTWLAVMQGKPYSPTLCCVAWDIHPPPGLFHDEECVVLAFQAYLQVGRWDAWLDHLAPLDLPTLAQAARVLLAPLGE